MKNLALGFCSIRPLQLSEDVNDGREEEYLICLKQLKRVLPESFDLLICENTIDDPDQIKNDELRELLSESELCAVGSEANIGTKNKGMGELLMLKSALDETDLDNYKNISYITARRFFTCPYVFERTERLEKQALLSNPDFAFLNGKFVESHKQGLYNDMFFSMNASVILDYANYAMDHIESNTNQEIGSEQLLFNFVKENKVTYEWLDWLGMVRNDWERNRKVLDVNNFHVC
jgi:hypothetical protein